MEKKNSCFLETGTGNLRTLSVWRSFSHNSAREPPQFRDTHPPTSADFIAAPTAELNGRYPELQGMLRTIPEVAIIPCGLKLLFLSQT